MKFLPTPDTHRIDAQLVDALPYKLKHIGWGAGSVSVRSIDGWTKREIGKQHHLYQKMRFQSPPMAWWEKYSFLSDIATLRRQLNHEPTFKVRLLELQRNLNRRKMK